MHLESIAMSVEYQRSKKNMLVLIIYQVHVVFSYTLEQELRAGFEAEGKSSGKPRLLVTAAVGAGKSTVDGGYDVAKIAK